MTQLSIRDLRKRHGRTFALDGISFDVEAGAFCVVVGPSGCGKSTLLRLLGGLDAADGGTIRFDGEDVAGLPPQRRRIGFVFQQFALYPHMRVRDNLEYGLRIAGMDGAVRRQKLERVVELLQLQGMLDRRPDQLSGGQQQRVAIGRAIIREPKLLLLDEPLSSLDAGLRTELRAELRALHDKIGATSIFVTHDQADAFALADQIIVLNHGRIEQTGTPQALYHGPANLFVAGFLGQPPMNLIAATVRPDGGVITAGGTLLMPSVPAPPGAIWLGIRPERVSLEDGGIPARLEAAEFTGAQYLVRARLEDQRVTLLADHRPTAAVIRLRLDPGAICVFRREDTVPQSEPGGL